MSVPPHHSSYAVAPATLAELVEAVRSAERVIAVGAATKPRLSHVADATKISTLLLTGITEYDPSEFTFTALAGTRLRDIIPALAERGQYLPFDPMLVEAGATLGGTVASGLSGPGRFRYGGLRDFILGVRFVDGLGRLLRMGGKVVKNAAGFDLPKFFVGSLGRFGVLAEITFKVFPRPSSSLTLRLDAVTPEETSRLLTELANSRFEFDALDVAPRQPGVLARLAGPESALRALGSEVLARWRGEILPPETGHAIWNDIREFGWADANHALLKVPVTPSAIPSVLSQFPESACYHISGGGNMAYVSIIPGDLQNLRAPALMIRSGMPPREPKDLHGGGFSTLWPSSQIADNPRAYQIARAVKQALDPASRFPELDD